MTGVEPASSSAPGVQQVPDGVLARRAALGDRDAFAVIFDRHGYAVFRYALHMLDGHVQDAEDAVQAAWTRAWLHLGDFRGEAQLRTWLFRIAANEVLSARRRRRPLLVEDDLLEARPARSGEQPEPRFAELELREALDLALVELPWRQRASWILREVDGLSYEEIASVLDTTPAVVRGQLHRARRTLAVRLEQWR